MIVIAVVAVFAVVVLAAGWARISSARAERRSVEDYGRALDRLGDVAKRSESGAPVHAPSSTELAQPHVRPSGGDADQRFRPAAAPREAPAPRVRLQPPVPGEALPTFDDLGHDGAGAGARARGAEQVAEPQALVTEPQALVTEPQALVDEEPLTVVLPAVRPSGPAPGAEGPVLGPPLPSEAGPVLGPPLPGGSLPGGSLPGGEGEPGPPGLASGPARVFDAEAGAFDEGDPEGGTAAGPGERGQRMRRAATGAAAAVALGALAVGGWQLAVDSSSHGHPAATGPAPTPTGQRQVNTSPGDAGHPRTGGAASGGKTPAPGGGQGHDPAPKSTSTTLEPLSQTSTVVDYAAPADHYTITFSVSTAGDCWLGAQASPGGSYLWMQTVAPGGTTSYSATGPVVIRLGAPRLVSISVNGLKVVLPPGNVQPYDISFTPSSSSAAA